MAGRVRTETRQSHDTAAAADIDAAHWRIARRQRFRRRPGLRGGDAVARSGSEPCPDPAFAGAGPCAIHAAAGTVAPSDAVPAPVPRGRACRRRGDMASEPVPPVWGVQLWGRAGWKCTAPALLPVPAVGGRKACAGIQRCSKACAAAAQSRASGGWSLRRRMVAEEQHCLRAGFRAGVPAPPPVLPVPPPAPETDGGGATTPGFPSVRRRCR